MIALVTGVAGFIGSNLAHRLLEDGWTVRGVDCFTEYYDVTQKRANAEALVSSDRFELIEQDLLTVDLQAALDGATAVFHQAGQPGVRLSWADGFRTYTELNVDATQRLLEAARRSPIDRFVYASSSSIYGNSATYPTYESAIPDPYSPYGVTKLAGELLCNAYASNFGVPVISLRYFTVYGPAQRPDMATHRLIEAALTGEAFPIFGDGSQVRDFTYVGDVVAANLLAAQAEIKPGTAVNIAGGGATSLADLIEIVSEIVGREVPIKQGPTQAGDVQRTGGATDMARSVLGWEASVGIEEGVRLQAEWHLERRNAQR